MTSTGNNNGNWTIANNYGQMTVATEGAAGSFVTGSSQGAALFGNSSNAVAQIFTNNIVRATFDSSGNLGLGVTANTTSLGGTYSLLAVGKASGSGILMGQTDLTAADSTASQFLGKTTGASGYQLLGGMLVQTDGSSTTNAVGRLAFYTATGGSLSERARIDSSGNLLVGTTATPSSTQSGFSVDSFGMLMSVPSGNVNAAWYKPSSPSNGTFQVFIVGGSTVGSISYNGSLTLYNQTSDYRIKTVIKTVSDAGTRIDAVQPIEYELKENGNRIKGFLAHQFAEVYPNSVTGEKDAVDSEGKPVYQSMQASSSEVMADLIAEIQDLRKRLAALEAK